MTTNGISYGDRNGLQDELKRRPSHGPSCPMPQGLVPPSNQTAASSEPPNVLICFKSLKKTSENHASKPEKPKKENTRQQKRSKSRELRGSILYVGCDCERRNGLQDQCPRSECQGSPECLTVPPTCPPSEFANGKHLEKITQEMMKKRKAAEEKMNRNKEELGKTNGKEDKKGMVDYDCFPLDLLMQEDGSCPICDRPFDNCHDKNVLVDGSAIIVGPINIELPSDCMCCPGAS